MRLLAVAKAFKEAHWLAILVGYLHGLRASEVVGIRRDDIKNGFLSVQRGKKSRHTIQPLLESPSPLLSERRAVIEFASYLAPNQRLFAWTRQTFFNVLRRHGARAGIPEHQCHPHILKRSCAVHMIASKGLPATQAWLGHVSGASTLIYTAMSMGDAAKAAQESLCV